MPDDRIQPEDFSRHKNHTRFHVLVLLPEFQERVEKIRLELGVPKNFADDFAALEWLRQKGYFYQALLPSPFNREENNLFRDKVFEISRSFYLPLNFFHWAGTGVGWYIARNRIQLTENSWEVMMPILSSEQKAEWVGIAVFGHLTGEEWNKAALKLKEAQDQYLKPEVMDSHRPKPQFPRDIEILEWMAERSSMAKGEDRLTIADVAEQFEISEDAVNKAIKRLNDLSISYFRKPLRPEDIKLGS